MQYTVVDSEERATETSTSCKVISLKSEKQQVYVTKKRLQEFTVLCSAAQWLGYQTDWHSLTVSPAFLQPSLTSH